MTSFSPTLDPTQQGYWGRTFQPTLPATMRSTNGTLWWPFAEMSICKARKCKRYTAGSDTLLYLSIISVEDLCTPLSTCVLLPCQRGTS